MPENKIGATGAGQAQPVTAQPQQPAGEPQTPIEQPQGELPTDISKRTQEQFDKLLDSNQKLFQANELLRQEMVKRNEANAVFQSINQPVQQPAVQPVNPQDFMEVDEYGVKFVNEIKLQGAISAINERATKAERVVQNYIQGAEQREIDRQNKEAFVTYPELNPTSQNFDKPLSDFTRAVIYDSLINPQSYGGRNLTFKEAADLVKSRIATGEKVTTTEETVVENKPKEVSAQVAQEQKEQGSLAAAGQGQPQRTMSAEEDLETLRQMTRLGGANSDRAIIERLKRIPEHMRKASEEEVT